MVPFQLKCMLLAGRLVLRFNLSQILFSRLRVANRYLLELVCALRIPGQISSVNETSLITLPGASVVKNWFTQRVDAISEFA